MDEVVIELIIATEQASIRASVMPLKCLYELDDWIRASFTLKKLDSRLEANSVLQEKLGAAHEIIWKDVSLLYDFETKIGCFSTLFYVPKHKCCLTDEILNATRRGEISTNPLRWRGGFLTFLWEKLPEWLYGRKRYINQYKNFPQ